MVEFKMYEDPTPREKLLQLFSLSLRQKYSRQNIRRSLQRDHTLVFYRGNFTIKSGRYEVNYIISGYAKVVDQDAFMKVDTGDPNFSWSLQPW